MHHPAEQGLRPRINGEPVMTTNVRVHHPAEQGLRLVGIIICVNHKLVIVRVHHPAEQGLRLAALSEERPKKQGVRVHHPAEQGLRQVRKCHFNSVKGTSECIIQQNKD